MFLFVSFPDSSMNSFSANHRRFLDQTRLNCQYSPVRSLFIHQWRAFKRWQDIDKYNTEHFEHMQRIKTAIPLGNKLYISPERSTDVMPKVAIQDQDRYRQGAMPFNWLINHTQMRYLDHSFDNIRRCGEYKHFQNLQYDQRFLPERLIFLGADLAAAHFIVHRKGKVKFVGDDRWYKREGRFGQYQLPGKKVEGLYLEAIDASGTELMFEGFDNLYDLDFLRMFSLRNCHWIDDWVLSRIGGMFSESLEFLDLSGCRRISAKGLLGLRSLTKLRFLRLEGLEKVDGVAKSALLLEEAIPNLEVIGLDYDCALSALEAEEKLLSHDRVVIDAKGNAFVEDDNGRLFYVKGNVNERPSVCDMDKPLMTSLIRRELPKMEPDEFEQLDELASGKLRHFLVGSPSGYSWSEQVETILSHEEQWQRNERIPTDVKMLPKYKRTPLLEARRRAALLLEADKEKPKIGGGDDGRKQHLQAGEEEKEEERGKRLEAA